MPARDIYHNAVRNALEKDSWQITKDPFILKWGTIVLAFQAADIRPYTEFAVT